MKTTGEKKKSENNESDEESGGEDENDDEDEGSHSGSESEEDEVDYKIGGYHRVRIGGLWHQYQKQALGLFESKVFFSNQ